MSIRDRIAELLMRITPDPRPPTQEEELRRAEQSGIPPLGGAVYPPEKTDLDEFYSGRSRR